MAAKKEVIVGAIKRVEVDGAAGRSRVANGGRATTLGRFSAKIPLHPGASRAQIPTPCQRFSTCA